MLKLQNRIVTLILLFVFFHGNRRFCLHFNMSSIILITKKCQKGRGARKNNVELLPKIFLGLAMPLRGIIKLAGRKGSDYHLTTSWWGRPNPEDLINRKLDDLRTENKKNNKTNKNE